VGAIAIKRLFFPAVSQVDMQSKNFKGRFGFPDISVPLVSSRRMTEARGSTFFIVFTISLAVFTDVFLYGVIIPVIPFAFTQQMGIEPDAVQSAVSKSLAVYSSGLIAGSIAFGYACDKMSNRRVSMLIGLLTLIAATIVLCVCKSIALFMVGRAIQGISASVVWSVGLAVIADTAGANQVAYFMSYPGIAMNLGHFCGPLVGGIVYEKAGYYPVFYVCFGVLVMDVVLRLLMIEKSQLPKKLKKFDDQSNSANSVELASRETRGGLPLLTPASQDEESQFVLKVSPYHIHNVDTMFGLKIFPTFGLLKHSCVLITLFQSLIIAWITAAFEATLTLHLKELFDFNSLGSALMFLALAAPCIVEPLIGKLADRFGPRLLVTCGLLMLTPLLILLGVPQHDSTNQVVFFAAILTLIGFGIIVLFPPVMGELCHTVSEIERYNPGKFGPGRGFGQAYGLFFISYSLGALIGPFHSGGVFHDQGWNTTVLSLGIVTAVAAIPSAIFTGGNLIYKFKNRA
jgi:MFS family permease